MWAAVLKLQEGRTNSSRDLNCDIPKYLEYLEYMYIHIINTSKISQPALVCPACGNAISGATHQIGRGVTVAANVRGSVSRVSHCGTCE